MINDPWRASVPLTRRRASVPSTASLLQERRRVAAQHTTVRSSMRGLSVRVRSVLSRAGARLSEATAEKLTYGASSRGQTGAPVARCSISAACECGRARRRSGLRQQGGLARPLGRNVQQRCTSRRWRPTRRRGAGVRRRVGAHQIAGSFAGPTIASICFLDGPWHVAALLS